MDIPLNIKVSCSDGSCGRTTTLILMPTNGEITHVVIGDGSYPETEYLVRQFPQNRIVFERGDNASWVCN